MPKKIEHPLSVANPLFSFQVSSEMARLFREKDWSKTDLGSVDTWPQSLRFAVGIMLDSPLPMVVAWGKARTFLYNDAYIKILGQKHPQAFGQPFAEVWADVWATVQTSIENVDQGKSVFFEDLPFSSTRNGIQELFYATFSYSPIRDENGAVRGLFCAVVETTARVHVQQQLIEAKEQAERDRAKFEAAFHAVAEGIFIFDSKGDPVFMNDAAAKVFGSEVAADVRRRVEYYFERLDLFEMNDQLIPISEWPVSKALRGESFREWHIKAHRRDTNERWIWSSSGELAKQEGSDITLAVVILRDITQQVRAADELVIAKEEAERANSLKISFLANMSHEIRTPLAAIIGFSNLLQEDDVEPAERLGFLRTIVRNGNALTRIIDDILDLAKVEAGKLEVENIAFPLKSVAADVVDMFKDIAKEKQIYLTLNIDDGVPTQISTDPTRLRQILVNLIGNAIKFTEQGGVRVSISAIGYTESSATIRISITDTGIGMTEEQSARLFMPFTQADNSMTRKFGGTGLGLALSQRLSQALGGKITIVESRFGEGSTFALTFLTSVEPKETTTKFNPAQIDSCKDLSLQGLRILVADDSPDNQFLIERILIRNGAKVGTAMDGAEAVRKALSEPFDLVLMDIQMPHLDGYQAKQKLDHEGFTTPILALTAHAMAEERLKTKAAGFAGHLTKPLNAPELVKTIASVARATMS